MRVLAETFASGNNIRAIQTLPLPTLTPRLALFLLATLFMAGSFSAFAGETPSQAHEAGYQWPAYSPNLDYNVNKAYPALKPPTKVLDDVAGVAGTVKSGWWCFRYGKDANKLVTEKAWTPMLAYMDTEFAYFREVMGWPADKRARGGYYSTIYLFGSGLSTDKAKNTDLGGWQSVVSYKGEDWPMVLASYYPIYSFDPACPYEDRKFQQGALVHEGIHSILADMPGCKEAGWFQEGGNTWLQSEAAARRTGDYGSMGWLSAGAMIAPFMPIECYSGWLQDGSFGGPSAEGVNRLENNVQVCTWRRLLGGSQYGESFARFMGEAVSPGSVAWIWQNCRGRVLEGLAKAPGGLGDAQTRRLITEFRARQAMCDFGKWSGAFKQLLHGAWKMSIGPENEPSWIQCPAWKATCYAATRQEGQMLYPDALTLPGWSGANQIPLTVNGDGSANVTFLPKSAGMTCQIVYRAADGSVIYSPPVAKGECRIAFPKPPKNNVVIAVISNTDYTYKGEATRKARFDYRLALGQGITGPADIYTEWWE